MPRKIKNLCSKYQIGFIRVKEAIFWTCVDEGQTTIKTIFEHSSTRISKSFWEAWAQKKYTKQCDSPTYK